MKTLIINSKPFALPTTWEELTFSQKLYAFSILERVLTGDLVNNPQLGLIYFLCHLTGYKPSPQFNTYRQTINFNLLRIAEQLTLPFSISPDSATITPHLTFATNPIPFIRLKNKTYPGAKFLLDATVRTDLTARPFIDCFDLLTAVNTLPDIDKKQQCLHQLIAILYPSTPHYHTNLTSTHTEAVALLPAPIKFGILCWFTSIVRFYTSHPHYQLLFNRNTPADDDPKVSLGMNEVALFLCSEGYGDPLTMNLTDYFDAQLKSLRDTITRALASGTKPEDLTARTGIPISTILQLS